jgi:hypothetical protein
MIYEGTTILMQFVHISLSIINLYVMQKMFKNLGLPKQESNMNEFEKKAKEAIEAEISQQANSFVKDIEPNAENQGYDSDEELSVNPFSGRELLPASGNGLSYV